MTPQMPHMGLTIPADAAHRATTDSVSTTIPRHADEQTATPRPHMARARTRQTRSPIGGPRLDVGRTNRCRLLVPLFSGTNHPDIAAGRSPGLATRRSGSLANCGPPPPLNRPSKLDSVKSTAGAVHISSSHASIESKVEAHAPNPSTSRASGVACSPKFVRHPPIMVIAIKTAAKMKVVDRKTKTYQRPRGEDSFILHANRVGHSAILPHSRTQNPLRRSNAACLRSHRPSTSQTTQIPLIRPTPGCHSRTIEVTTPQCAKHLWLYAQLGRSTHDLSPYPGHKVL